MIFLRAFHDTFDGRAARTAFFIVGGAALSFLVVLLWLGPGEAVLELPFIAAGLVGAVGPLMLLFLWNLACAPYRMERDSRLTIEEKARLLAEELSEFTSGYYNFSERDLAQVTIRFRETNLSKDGVFVIFAPSCPEALDAASDLSEAINLSGVNCTAHGGGMFPHNLNDRGIVVYHGAGQGPSEEAEKIISALEPLGLKINRGNAGRPESGACIYVGRPPTASTLSGL